MQEVPMCFLLLENMSFSPQMDVQRVYDCITHCCQVSLGFLSITGSRRFISFSQASWNETLMSEFNPIVNG